MLTARTKIDPVTKKNISPKKKKKGDWTVIEWPTNYKLTNSTPTHKKYFILGHHFGYVYSYWGFLEPIIFLLSVSNFHPTIYFWVAFIQQTWSLISNYLRLFDVKWLISSSGIEHFSLIKPIILIIDLKSSARAWLYSRLLSFKPSSKPNVSAHMFQN